MKGEVTMFANLMNQEEKEKFLELIYKIANYDQNYTDEEEELVNNYKIELGLNTVPETDTIKNLIIYFGNKEEQVKKIVFFELYGMIMADGAIVNKEGEILMQIKEKFALEKETFESLISVALELQKAYDDVYSTVFD